jgi:hypothetical protein
MRSLGRDVKRGRTMRTVRRGRGAPRPRPAEEAAGPMHAHGDTLAQEAQQGRPHADAGGKLLDALQWYRDAHDYLCAYVRDQGLRASREPDRAHEPSA